MTNDNDEDVTKRFANMSMVIGLIMLIIALGVALLIGSMLDG